MRDKIAEAQLELNDTDPVKESSTAEDGSVNATLREGRRLFNQKPKDGIKYLIDSKVVENTPKSVAEMLVETLPGGRAAMFSKTKIGEYLGENEPFNLAVLKEFAAAQDFKDMSFDKALRSYLWSFRLPGEAQKIDRMMDAFAQRFCDCNTKIFSSKDTCYVLAFSVIMLATNLHNPAIKQKQTVESFISMNRGIDNGKDIDPELLTYLYHNMKAAAFKIPDDEENASIAFFNPERDGWLTKEGGSHKSWKKRWFTLCNNCLYYFTSPDVCRSVRSVSSPNSTQSTKPKGTIPLQNLEVREYPKKPNCFEILCVDGEGSVKAAKVNRQGQYVQGENIRCLCAVLIRCPRRAAHVV